LTRQLENLDFADNLALLSHSQAQMREKTAKLNRISKQVGLLIVDLFLQEAKGEGEQHQSITILKIRELSGLEISSKLPSTKLQHKHITLEHQAKKQDLCVLTGPGYTSYPSFLNLT
jgi:hypothetical protein